MQVVCDGCSASHLPRTGATAAGDANVRNVVGGLQGAPAESLSESRNSFADKAALLGTMSTLSSHSYTQQTGEKNV